MEEYFRNLWMALRGKNPLRAELEDAKMEYEATVKQVENLEETYKQLVSAMGDCDKKITDYQVLVENLRQRIEEKDQILAQTKKDYQARIKDYNIAIDELKERLKEACNMKQKKQNRQKQTKKQ